MGTRGLTRGMVALASAAVVVALPLAAAASEGVAPPGASDPGAAAAVATAPDPSGGAQPVVAPVPQPVPKPEPSPEPSESPAPGADPEPGAEPEPGEPSEPSQPSEPSEPSEPSQPSSPPEAPVPPAPTGPAPIIQPRCWMGPHQPLYVLRNQDRERPLRFTMSAPGAGKRGVLAPKGGGADTAWFVGTGSYPHPGLVVADYEEVGGGKGVVVAPDVSPLYCTYTVRPVVRWLDSGGNDVMPRADQVQGWTLQLDGPLGALDCSWNGAGLSCHGTAKAGGPLAPGTFSVLDPDTELHVPAFGRTTYSVRASPDPEGFRLIGGVGDMTLPDLADGLDQDSVDLRAPDFFPARLQQGTASQVAAVTFESKPSKVTDVRGTTVGRGGAVPGPGTGALPPAAPRPPRVVPGEATFMLPATGADPATFVVLGGALVTLGVLAAALAATRLRRS